MEKKYLVENPEREHEILERFDQFLDHISPFLLTFGIRPMYSWYLIEIQMEKLVAGMKGEVDILIGEFEPASPELYERSLNKIRALDSEMNPHRLHHLAAIDLAWQGGLKWIPSLNYLVGIEVKCCYLPWGAPEISEDEMRSRKASKSDVKGIRKQVDKLLTLGFNKVGLFEFVANPPSDGIGNQPWNAAARTVGRSMDAMNKIFSERLPEDSPVGHGASSFGGVFGREEHHSGVYEYPIFRVARNNSRLAQEESVKANRRELERNLSQILQEMSPPRSTPAVFVRDRKTGEIRFVNEGITRG